MFVLRATRGTLKRSKKFYPKSGTLKVFVFSILVKNNDLCCRRVAEGGAERCGDISSTRNRESDWVEECFVEGSFLPTFSGLFSYATVNINGLTVQLSHYYSCSVISLQFLLPCFLNLLQCQDREEESRQ